MKKYFFLMFSMVLFFSFTSFAQDSTPAKKGKSGLENKVDKITADLGLNDSERAAVTSLFTKQAADLKVFRTSNPDKESADFKAKQKEFRGTQDAELKVVIGDAKFKKLQEIRAAEKKMKEQKTE